MKITKIDDGKREKKKDALDGQEHTKDIVALN